MAALVPPTNTLNIALPPPPQNPATFTDITNAKEYVERLTYIKLANPVAPNIDNEIGEAKSYESAVIFSHNPSPAAAPAWLAQIAQDIANINVNIARIIRHQDESPIILANAHAGPKGVLYNPTILIAGWAPLLAAPNPTTRDELMSFTAFQCAASAANLGLPVLPPGTPVLSQRHQIAACIGVNI